MDVINFLSDTATLPSPEMRQAIFEAEMGDDVSGEDPSANRLQEMAADMLGKEDALIVSSGTMGNLVASLAHCQRGDEMIVGELSHISRGEAGGPSVLGGIAIKTIMEDESRAARPRRGEGGDKARRHALSPDGDGGDREHSQRHRRDASDP